MTCTADDWEAAQRKLAVAAQDEMNRRTKGENPRFTKPEPRIPIFRWWVRLLMVDVKNVKIPGRGSEYPWPCWVTGNITNIDYPESMPGPKLQRVCALIQAESKADVRYECDRVWAGPYVYRSIEIRHRNWLPNLRTLYQNNGEDDDQPVPRPEKG